MEQRSLVHAFAASEATRRLDVGFPPTRARALAEEVSARRCRRSAAHPGPEAAPAIPAIWASRVSAPRSCSRPRGRDPGFPSLPPSAPASCRRCRINLRRARWIASKGGLAKRHRAHRKSQAAVSMRAREARLSRFRWNRCRPPSERPMDRGKRSVRAAFRPGYARAWRYGDRCPARLRDRARPSAPTRGPHRRPP